MSVRRALTRTAVGLLCAWLLTACTGDEPQAVVAPTPASSSLPPPTLPPSLPLATPPVPALGCPEGDVDDAVCRFVTAVQADELDSLSEGERAIADELGGALPAGGWDIVLCDVAGDVTVLCELDFEAASDNLALSVGPVNLEDFVDGELVTSDGGPPVYEVNGFLGTGPPGSFEL